MKSKKHIVHFTSSLKRGGAEHILHSLISGLHGSYNQTVLYIHDGPYRKQIEECGVTCIKIKGVFTTYDPLFVHRTYKILRRLSPDVIHTLLWSATIAGRIVGHILSIPVVSVYHGNLDQDGMIRNFCDWLTISLSAYNCAVSSGVAESLKVISPQVAPYIIHNGIDCTYSRSAKTRNDISFTGDHFVIGAVGRLVSIKKFDMLIDAFAHLQKKDATIRLCIIGVGPELYSLRERIAGYNMQHAVQFLADVPAVAYYHLFDCFVLPSPREGISMALLEAMRVRVPAVVVNDQQHPVIQHGVNGLVVPAPEAQLIAAAIKEIQCDSMRAHQLADAGYATVLHSFNRDRMIAAYKKIFHSAMSTQ